MNLTNFQLTNPMGCVELLAFGMNWDLHNFADFAGLQIDTVKNEAVMSWFVPRDSQSPWGDVQNTASGCRLRFRGVGEVRVSPRDDAYPASEGLTVESIAKVIPWEREFPLQPDWGSEEQFNLRFTLQDERTIEIAAASAELEPIHG